MLGPECPADAVRDGCGDRWAGVGGDDGRGGPCGADRGLDTAARDGAGDPHADGQGPPGPRVLPANVRGAVDPSRATGTGRGRRRGWSRTRPHCPRSTSGGDAIVTHRAPRVWRRCRHNVTWSAVKTTTTNMTAPTVHVSGAAKIASMVWTVMVCRPRRYRSRRAGARWPRPGCETAPVIGPATSSPSPRAADSSSRDSPAVRPNASATASMDCGRLAHQDLCGRVGHDGEAEVGAEDVGGVLGDDGEAGGCVCGRPWPSGTGTGRLRGRA